MILRQFTMDDYDAVFTFWQSIEEGLGLGRSDTQEEIAKKCQRDPDLFLIAEEREKVIGTVMGGFDGRRGMVYHLAVAASCRRQGVGTQLMDELEARLRAKGCRKAYLLVVPENDEAPPFYQNRGWQVMNMILFGKEL